MKNITIAVFGLLFCLGQLQADTDYERDQQYAFIRDSLNASIQNANQLVCMVSAMRPDALVNDGNYLAAVYPSDCKTDENGPQNISGSNSQAQTAKANAEDRKLFNAVLNVTRATADAPVKSKVWLDKANEEVYLSVEQIADVSENAPNGEFEMYWNDILKGGNRYDLPEGSMTGVGLLKARDNIIQYVEQSFEYQGSMVAKYLENGDIEGEFVNYLPTYDNTWDENSFSIYNGLSKFYFNQKNRVYCAQLLEVNKITLSKIEGDDSFERTATQTLDPSLLESFGISNQETCYSTDKNKALRNVHSYGVYNMDGSRLDIGPTGFPIHAQVRDGNGGTEDIFGHAGWSGVWISGEGAALVDKDTIFKREVYQTGEESGDEKNYRLRPIEISATKRETSYQSLNSLDGLPLILDGVFLSIYDTMHELEDQFSVTDVIESGVLDIADIDFGEEFITQLDSELVSLLALEGASVIGLEGAEISEELLAELGAEFANLVLHDSIEVIEVSPEGIEVSEALLAELEAEFLAILEDNPIEGIVIGTDGIEVSEELLSELEAEFAGLLEHHPTQGSDLAVLNQELLDQLPDNILSLVGYDQYVVSYDAEADEIVFTQGFKYNPRLSDNVFSTPIRLPRSVFVELLTDSFGSTISLGSPYFGPNNGNKSYQISKAALNNPSLANGVMVSTSGKSSLSEMSGLQFVCIRDCVTGDTFSQSFSEAVSAIEDKTANKRVSNPFVEIPQLGAKKSDFATYQFSNGLLYDEAGLEITRGEAFNQLMASSDDPFGIFDGLEYTDNLGNTWNLGASSAGILIPVDELDKLKCTEDDSIPNPTADLYCPSSYYTKNISVVYYLQIEQYPDYELLTESGEVVEFSSPKKLSYTVPSGSSFRAGEQFSLSYSEHGSLWGFPDGVYDTSTNTYVDGYPDQWTKNHIYRDYFTIPDGGLLMDDEGNSYKVKALSSEEWLATAPEFVGVFNYSPDTSDIPQEGILRYTADSDSTDYIGDRPVEDIINDGRPSVIHGEVLYDPSPSQ